MTTAVIYSNGNQECERIAQLLKSLPQVSEFLRYDLDKDLARHSLKWNLEEMHRILKFHMVTNI